MPGTVLWETGTCWCHQGQGISSLSAINKQREAEYFPAKAALSGESATSTPVKTVVLLAWLHGVDGGPMVVLPVGQPSLAAGQGILLWQARTTKAPVACHRVGGTPPLCHKSMETQSASLCGSV